MRTTLHITLLPLEVRCVHYYTVHWYYLRHDAYHITSISAQYMRKRRANDLNYLAATMAISKSTRLPLSSAQARKRRPASDEPNGRGYAAGVPARRPRPTSMSPVITDEDIMCGLTASPRIAHSNHGLPENVRQLGLLDQPCLYLEMEARHFTHVVGG